MVSSKKYTVSWTEKAEKSLEKIYKYIKEESPSAAAKVKKEIFLASKALTTYPEKHQIDEYYPSQNGNIRRLFRWDFRIVYEIHENEVLILNVYRTSQPPEYINPNPRTII